MTIECKDLEWKEGNNYVFTQGVNASYSVSVYAREGGRFEWYVKPFGGIEQRDIADDFPSAQAAANEHNKQQFQAIIEEWRKG